jgi:hypothetical protein
MWPGIDAMSPVSAAISPSIEPLPNFSGSLLVAFAGRVRTSTRRRPRRRRAEVRAARRSTPERSTVRQ